MRAADVARELDIPANQASFHLRQLAKYGLVEEAPEEARDKRDRVWRPTSGAASQRRPHASSRRQPGGKAAVAVFRRSAARLGRTASSTRRTPTPRAPSTLRAVTDERGQAHQGRGAASWPASSTRCCRAVVGAGPAAATTARRTYLLFQVLQPYPEAARAPSPRRGLGSLRARPTPPRRPRRRRRGPRPPRRRGGRPRRPAAAHQALPGRCSRPARPASSVEVRVPPYAAVQVVPGVRHTRGTPPAVVEMDAATWIALATGDLAWADAERLRPGPRQRRARRPHAVPAAGLTPSGSP